MQALLDGQLGTPTISFLGHSWRIFRRGSCPVQAAFPKVKSFIEFIEGAWDAKKKESCWQISRLELEKRLKGRISEFLEIPINSF
jgi:hypothetical protein